MIGHNVCCYRVICGKLSLNYPSFSLLSGALDTVDMGNLKVNENTFRGDNSYQEKDDGHCIWGRL